MTDAFIIGRREGSFAKFAGLTDHWYSQDRICALLRGQIIPITRENIDAFNEGFKSGYKTEREENV